MANEESKFKISQNISYPSHLDSFEKKSSPAFGKAVGDVIYSEWFHRGSGRCRFYASKAIFQENRIYANGLVNMEKYHDKLGTNGDVSLLSLSKKSLSRLPKIVDLVVNGMVNRKYSIVAKAIDPVSQDNKQAYRKRIESDQNTLPIIQQAKEASGLDIASMPVEEIPETKEELDIHMQMEWKPSNCLSNQLAIATVMAENEYDLTIKKQIVRDLVVDGIGCNYTRLNPSKGIIQKRIDPSDLIYSATKDPYFRDCFYKGHVEEVLVSDIFIEYPKLLNYENEEVRKEIVESGASWSKLHSLSASDSLKGTTKLLYFTYKTFRERASKIKKKANGEVIIDDAKEFFDESKPKDKKDKFTRASVVEEVLFEGVMVLGTNILLKWELAKSMSRPKSNTQKVCEQYHIVAPNFQDGIITSLVTRMKPIEDKVNVTELKAEQIIQGITPDGIAIDIDALAEIDLGDGKNQTVQETLNMYLQKGSYLYRSSQIGGDYTNAKPFQEVQTGDSINKLTALRNENNGYIAELTDVVGLNKASDASNPDRDSLVGIQKMAAYSSNLATRHILDATGYLTLKSAETISYSISDILKYYPSLREDLIRKIGATAVDDLDYVKDLHLSDFAIFFELEMDDEERAMLDADLSAAVEKGFIGVDDKYRIRDFKVLKLAIQYLSILIKKRAKITQKQEADKFKMQADENIRASQQAEQFKQQTAQMQANFDAQKQQMISEGEIEKEKARGEQDRLTLTQKIQGDKELQVLINQGMIQKNSIIEENKDTRIDKASSNQSELAHQKANNAPPIDFEAKNADMKMFELNQ